METREYICLSEANTSPISMVRAHEKCDEFDDNANINKRLDGWPKLSANQYAPEMYGGLAFNCSYQN